MIDTMIMMQAAPAAIDAARQEMEESAASHTDDRVKITLQALQQLARYLCQHPGTQECDLVLGLRSRSAYSRLESFPRKYQRRSSTNADLLTPARWPSIPSRRPARGRRKIRCQLPAGPARSGRTTQRALLTKPLMDELAIDTGGISFYDTNGLGEAVSHVIKSGTRYLHDAHLRAKPTTKMDGTYRNIQVKAAQRQIQTFLPSWLLQRITQRQ